MAIENDLREKIIKQFPVDAIHIKEDNGREYYACPACRRPVAMSKERCGSCLQTLNWDRIREEDKRRCGVKKATLVFDVPGDFFVSDCRKCPLSYIAKIDGDNVYECPLSMRNNCPLEISAN